MRLLRWLVFKFHCLACERVLSYGQLEDSDKYWRNQETPQRRAGRLKTLKDKLNARH